MSSVALTFDDGPDRTWTPRLLDVLRALDVRATFFPISSRAAGAPDQQREMFRQKCEKVEVRRKI